MADWFLMFLIYSVAGWCWEVGLYIVREKRFVNRGFLTGPLCPIYGVGAVLCVALLYGRAGNPLWVFAVGSVVCACLEYVTHYVLEALFHARWWDYSANRFNLNGRVCLSATLGFGAAITALIFVIHPLTARIAAAIPAGPKNAAALVLYTVFVADLALSINALANLSMRLDALQGELAMALQKGIDSTVEMRRRIGGRIETSAAALSRHRLLRSFPGMQSARYRVATDYMARFRRKPRRDDDRRHNG